MTTNYDRRGIDERALAALVEHKEYVTTRCNEYEARTKMRHEKKIPVLAFLGYGRHGKDTAAEWWCKVAGTTYNSSASRAVLPIVATMAEDTPEHAWEVRHDNKDFWIEACHAIRRRELTLIVKLTLAVGDVLVGIRCGKELFEAKRLEMIDYSLWLKRPTIGRDKTVEFGEEDCDAVLLNNASKDLLYTRVERLHRLVSGSFSKGAA